MLDRLHFSHLESGDVKIQISDQTGIVIDVTIIPKIEWEKMRDDLIHSLPTTFKISDVYDYLTVLAVILETH